MGRNNERRLDDIIKSDNANEFSTPEPDSELTPEPSESKSRNYPSREGKTPVQFFLNKDAHRQLKIVGAERDLTNQDIMVEALNAWFLVNDLPPIA